ncbi:MAG: exodeoxyribonuclease VII large subunit, partial [Gammaproteobacteria bacterium]|nr:exodeoxyribonuclease VII large subunit [Gammaproteobacteria bacterium]
MSDTIFTVAELNRRARQAIERALPLLWVAGEISNLSRAASGHVYFTLKDEAAQVRCVMFRSRANLVPWQIANGEQVEVRGLASLYEARGDFQLTVEAMRRGGLGKLYEAFARLRAKLDAEGLFAPEKKRPLPAYPRTIGIVTSLQAAALRDIV